jgi:hypothetical protein
MRRFWRVYLLVLLVLEQIQTLPHYVSASNLG